MSKKKPQQFYIVVYEQVGNCVEEARRLGPMPADKARKVDAGMQHNLNHEKYYTRIEEVK